MLERIYTLCEIGGDPFYCGRTKRTLEERLKEHRYASKSGTESKYQHIRGLLRDGKDYEIILLEEVGLDTDRFEDFWVYSLILDGYDLTNMRAGDSKLAAERDAMLEMKNRGERFTDARSFLTARDREMAEAKARKATARLLEKTRKVERSSNSDVSLTRFIGDYGKVPLSPALQAIMDKRKKK